MQRKSAVGALGLFLLITSAAGAQRRADFPPRPADAAIFRAPTPGDIGRTLSGGTAVPATERPIMPSVDSLASPTPTPTKTCPMRVAVPDSSHVDRMPVVAADSTRHSSMPIVRPQCTNPLRR